jgi:Carboxypeptidase regulatory-like domain
MTTTPMRVVLVSIALILANAIASGLESRGSITGLVLDSTGAPIPNAKIIAVNAATLVAAPTNTNATGTYSIPYLIPGIYVVSAEMTGFGKVLRQDVALSVGDKLGIDFALEPANVQFSVEVIASTTALQTESANVGTVIDRRRIADLPLADGNGIVNSSTKTEKLVA